MGMIQETSNGIHPDAGTVPGSMSLELPDDTCPSDYHNELLAGLSRFEKEILMSGMESIKDTEDHTEFTGAGFFGHSVSHSGLF